VVLEATDMDEVARVVKELGIGEEKMMMLKAFNATNGDTLYDYKLELEYRESMEEKEERFRSMNAA